MASPHAPSISNNHPATIHINPKFKNAHINPNFINKPKTAPLQQTNPSTNIHINPKFIKAAQSLSAQHQHHLSVEQSTTTKPTYEETNVHNKLSYGETTKRVVQQQTIITKTNKKLVRTPAIIASKNITSEPIKNRLNPLVKNLPQKLVRQGALVRPAPKPTVAVGLLPRKALAKLLRSKYKIDRRVQPPVVRLNRSLSETLRQRSSRKVSINDYKLRRM